MGETSVTVVKNNNKCKKVTQKDRVCGRAADEPGKADDLQMYLYITWKAAKPVCRQKLSGHLTLTLFKPRDAISFLTGWVSND